MTTLRKLNAYHWSTEDYNNVIHFIKTGKIPESIVNEGPSAIQRFKRRSKLFSLDKDKGLLYTTHPITNKLLYVIEKANISMVLKKMYESLENSSNGLRSFYQIVSNKYLGITQKECFEFLKNQEAYQLHKPVVRKRVVSQPTRVSRRGERIYIDIIGPLPYAKFNDNYEYVLTCIDAFSKFTWCYSMKTKSMEEVYDNLDGLFYEFFERGHQVEYLCADNAFRSNNLIELCERYKIKQIFGTSYNPNAQGQIERFNKTIKQMIYQSMTKYNTKRWVDLLPKLVENYNNRVHSTTKFAPSFLFEESTIKERAKAKRKIFKQAKKMVKDTEKRYGKAIDFKVGDTVRISNYTQRSVRKNLFQRQYLPLWSRELYTIYKKTDGDPPRYYIINENKKKIDKPYYWNQLQKVNVDKMEKQKIERPLPSPFEEHLKKLHENRIDGKDYINRKIELPKTQLEERRENESQRRKRIPSKKYAEDYVV